MDLPTEHSLPSGISFINLIIEYTQFFHEISYLLFFVVIAGVTSTCTEGNAPLEM
jgi:hypothetical protein